MLRSISIRRNGVRPPLGFVSAQRAEKRGHGANGHFFSLDAPVATIILLRIEKQHGVDARARFPGWEKYVATKCAECWCC